MRLFFVMSFLSLVTRLFAASTTETVYKTAEIYDSLRAQVLALKAEQVGASRDEAVIAVLIETGYPEAVVTLVSVIDGSASLYFSNGGGIVGAGENERPKNASKKLIGIAASFSKNLAKTERTPLPQKGFTRFYIVTPSGLLTAEAKEDDLGEGRHVLSPFFHAAHELIAEIRLVEEQRGKKD